MKTNNYQLLVNQHLVSLSNNNKRKSHHSTRSASLKASPPSRKQALTTSKDLYSTWLRERHSLRRACSTIRRLASLVIPLPLNFKNRSRCLKASIQNYQGNRTLFKTLEHQLTKSEVLESMHSGTCSRDRPPPQEWSSQGHSACQRWERTRCWARGMQESWLAEKCLQNALNL